MKKGKIIIAPDFGVSRGFFLFINLLDYLKDDSYLFKVNVTENNGVKYAKFDKTILKKTLRQAFLEVKKITLDKRISIKNRATSHLVSNGTKKLIHLFNETLTNFKEFDSGIVNDYMAFIETPKKKQIIILP